MGERPTHDLATCPCNKCVAARRAEKPSAAKPEPPPLPNNRPSAHDLVIKDLEARKEFGLAKYGTVLQAFNGRDAAMDAYQEVLDLAAYLKQVTEEQNELIKHLAALVDVCDMAGWLGDPRVAKAQEVVNAAARRSAARGR